jgi:hypothetical protein
VSGFQGATLDISQGMRLYTDTRLVMPSYRWVGVGRISELAPWTEGLYWSGSNGIGGQFGSCGPGYDASDSGGYWEPLEIYGAFDESGGGQKLFICGHTLDSNGNPLGSVTVQGFLTSNDQYIGQVVSDSAGYYELLTAFNQAHYVVAYLPGSPDVSGTSVDTITPASAPT